MNNAKNIHLNDPIVISQIIKYLYSHQFKHQPLMAAIENTTDLDFIKHNDYLVCPRFIGTRCWIIFYQLDNVYYAVNFPKNKSKNVVLYSIDIVVNADFYAGTVMEGTYFKTENTKYLIIDEVYVLAGDNQLLKSKTDRLLQTSNYFKLNVKVNDAYQMHMCLHTNFEQSSLKDLYQRIKNNKINELVFYPQIYGMKIYLYTITKEDLIETVIKLADFYLLKTIHPDVYQLHTVDQNYRVGIALIPDTRTSKLCRQWFKNTNEKQLKVECKLHPDKQKWIPIRLLH